MSSAWSSLVGVWLWLMDSAATDGLRACRGRLWDYWGRHVVYLAAVRRATGRGLAASYDDSIMVSRSWFGPARTGGWQVGVCMCVEYGEDLWQQPRETRLETTSETTKPEDSRSVARRLEDPGLHQSTKAWRDLHRIWQGLGRSWEEHSHYFPRLTF